MLLTPWLSFLKSPFARSPRGPKKRRAMSSSVERLEDRTLLSFTATFNGGTLTVTGTGTTGNVVIAEDLSGNVTVKDNGVDTGLGPIAAGTITNLTVTDSGSGQTISLDNLTLFNATTTSITTAPNNGDTVFFDGVNSFGQNGGAVGVLTVVAPQVTFQGDTFSAISNVSSTGNETYTAAMNLNANSQFNGLGTAVLTFNGSINSQGGAKSLTVNTAATGTTASAIFNGPIGNAGAGGVLSSFTVNAGGGAGTATLGGANGGGVTTSGAQTYNAKILLGANDILTSTGSTVTFDQTLDGGFGLTVTAAGATTFDSDVGKTTALAGLTVTNTADVGPSVTTAGNQTYNGPVIVEQSTFTSTAGNVTFNGTLEGDPGLSGSASATILANAGTTTIKGNVGQAGNLNALTIDATGGGSILLGSNPAQAALLINTITSQTYGGATTLGATTVTLTAPAVAFPAASTIDDQANLSEALVITANNVTLASVGQTRAVQKLTVNGGGITSIVGASLITTTGNQAYHSGLSISAATTLTSNAGGNISVDGTTSGAFALTAQVNNAGTITFGGQVVGITTLTATSNSGLIDFGSLVSAGGTSSTGTISVSTNSGNIEFDGTIAGYSTIGLGSNSGNILTNSVTEPGTTAAGTLTVSTGGNGTITLGGLSLVATVATSSASGKTTFTGQVFGATKLTTSTGAGAIEFEGAINEPTAGGVYDVTSGSGTITFDSSVNSLATFVVTSNSGNLVFDGSIGGATAVIVGSQNPAATVTFNASVSVTSFSSAVINTTSTPPVLINNLATFIFNTSVDTSGDITILSGSVELDGTLQGANVFLGKVVNGGPFGYQNVPLILTGNSQVLGISQTGGGGTVNLGDVDSFGSTPFSLFVDGGTINFQGEVGNNHLLSTLNVTTPNVAGTLNFEGGEVDDPVRGFSGEIHTQGSQSYGFTSGTLFNDMIFRSDNSTVNFNGPSGGETINGTDPAGVIHSFDLEENNGSGGFIFLGSGGLSLNNLDNEIINMGDRGTAELGSLPSPYSQSTLGDQIYNTNAILGGLTTTIKTVTKTGAFTVSDVVFAKTVNGNVITASSALSIDTAGLVQFGDGSLTDQGVGVRSTSAAFGSVAVPLASITVNEQEFNSGSTKGDFAQAFFDFNPNFVPPDGVGGDINTYEAQTYQINTLLEGDVTFQSLGRFSGANFHQVFPVFFNGIIDTYSGVQGSHSGFFYGPATPWIDGLLTLTPNNTPAGMETINDGLTQFADGTIETALADNVQGFVAAKSIGAGEFLDAQNNVYLVNQPLAFFKTQPLTNAGGGFSGTTSTSPFQPTVTVFDILAANPAFNLNGQTPSVVTAGDQTYLTPVQVIGNATNQAIVLPNGSHIADATFTSTQSGNINFAATAPNTLPVGTPVSVLDSATAQPELQPVSEPPPFISASIETQTDGTVTLGDMGQTSALLYLITEGFSSPSAGTTLFSIPSIPTALITISATTNQTFFNSVQVANDVAVVANSITFGASLNAASANPAHGNVELDPQDEVITPSGTSTPVNSSGSVYITGAVGNLNPLLSLTINNPSTTSGLVPTGSPLVSGGFASTGGFDSAFIVGGSVKTVGSQVYNTQTYLGNGTTTFTSTAASAANNDDIEFNASLDTAPFATAPATLVIDNSGTTFFGDGSNTNIATKSTFINNSTTATVQTNLVTTGVGANSPLASITLNGVSGAPSSSGEIVFQIPVIVSNGNSLPSIATTGTQFWSGPVFLEDPVKTVSTGAANITFNQTVDGNAGLTVDTRGFTTFNGLVGSLSPLLSLVTDEDPTIGVGGAVIFNAAGSMAVPTVQTVGTQTYNNGVLLGANVVLASTPALAGSTPGTGAGNMTFNAIDTSPLVGSPQSLTTSTNGTQTFNGRVGGGSVLSSFTTLGTGGAASDRFNVAGSTNAAPTVKTTGTQNYANQVVLVNGTVFNTTSAGGNVLFGGSVNSANATAQNLAINALGSTQFGDGVGNDSVGALFPLLNLTIATGGGPTVFNVLNSSNTAPAVKTTGNQVYGNAAQLMQTTVLAATNVGTTKGNVTFDSTIDTSPSTSTPQALTVNALGTKTFEGGIGDNSVLASFTIDGNTAQGAGGLTYFFDPSSTSAAPTVNTVGGQSYNAPVALGNNTVLASSNATTGNIAFSNTVDSSKTNVSGGTNSTPMSLEVNVAGNFDVGEGSSTFFGHNFALASLVTGSTGSTRFFEAGSSNTTPSVTTTGPQMYNNKIVLRANTYLTSTNGSAINLNGVTLSPSGTATVNGFTVTVNANPSTSNPLSGYYTFGTTNVQVIQNGLSLTFINNGKSFSAKLASATATTVSIPSVGGLSLFGVKTTTALTAVLTHDTFTFYSGAVPTAANHITGLYTQGTSNVSITQSGLSLTFTNASGQNYKATLSSTSATTVSIPSVSGVSLFGVKTTVPITATITPNAITFSNGVVWNRTQWLKIDLTGTYFVGNQQVFITQTGTSLTFVDQNGNVSTGQMTSATQVIASSLYGVPNLTGLISNGKITFANQVVWSKTPNAGSGSGGGTDSPTV